MVVTGGDRTSGCEGAGGGGGGYGRGKGSRRGGTGGDDRPELKAGDIM